MQITSEIAGYLDQFNFNDSARKLIETALTDAEDHVGTEHLLLNLLSDGDIQTLLTSENNLPSHESIKHQLDIYIGKDPNKPPTNFGFTPVTQEVLVRAQEIAQVAEREADVMDLLLGILMTQKMGLAVNLLLLLANEGKMPSDKEYMRSILFGRVLVAMSKQRPEN